MWKDTFVTPNVLTRAIAQLRKGLGDDAFEARYIETVSKRGYRFIAPVAGSRKWNVRGAKRRTGGESQATIGPTAALWAFVITSLGIVGFGILRDARRRAAGAGDTGSRARLAPVDDRQRLVLISFHFA